MHRIEMWVATLWLLGASPSAQSTLPAAGRPAEVVGRVPSAGAVALRPAPSAAARQALAEASTLAGLARPLRGVARAGALEAAAKSYEALVGSFATEPLVVAEASWHAAELWRRHGSLVLAEQAYGRAAKRDPVRYGQRALLGVADMQRRLGLVEDALKSYSEVVACDPGTSRAQQARLWRGRLQYQLKRFDLATATLRAALESANGPRQVMDVVNWLARVRLQVGDLQGAASAIDYAESVVREAVASDPTEQGLLKLFDRLPARRLLQRARDKQVDAVEDANALERTRRRRCVRLSGQATPTHPGARRRWIGFVATGPRRRST